MFFTWVTYRIHFKKTNEENRLSKLKNLIPVSVKHNPMLPNIKEIINNTSAYQPLIVALRKHTNKNANNDSISWKDWRLVLNNL